MKDRVANSSVTLVTSSDAALTREDIDAALRHLRDTVGRPGPYDYAHYPAAHAHRIQRFIDMDLVNIKAIIGLGNEWEVLGTCTLFACCYAPHVHAYNHDTGEEKVFAFIDPS